MVQIGKEKNDIHRNRKFDFIKKYLHFIMKLTKHGRC